MVMKIIKPFIGVLATGFILMYFSELLFWAHVRPGDSWTGWLETWLAYSLLGFVFLSLVARFKVRSIWALFLAGAAFGWLAEGLVVQTTYESLPLSISFTGLAWHASISVWVGWYAIRKAIKAGFRRGLWVSALVGLLYGLWAISWWVEPGEKITAPLDFASFSCLSTLFVMLAYWLYDRTIPGSFAPSRPVELVVAALFLLYFVFITVPAAPLALALLPALLAMLYFALRLNQQSETGPDLLAVRLDPLPSLWRSLSLLALPLAAAAVYTLAFWAGLRWHTNWLFYIVTTPLGFILLSISMIKVWKTRSMAAIPPV